MTVKDFEDELNKLKKHRDISNYELCVVVRTLDDKWVTAFSLDNFYTDGESNIYFEPEVMVYKKDNLEPRTTIDNCYWLGDE